jgi:hypothetical protein
MSYRGSWKRYKVRLSSTAWLPAGFTGAVCLSVDDVHPTAGDSTRSHGEMARQALRHLERLLERHPKLHATLFTTPDWRSRGVVASNGLRHRIPVLRDLVYRVQPLPRGTLRLDRHPAFVSHLRAMPRTDVGLHGLHHVRRGPRHVEEFAGRTRVECERMLLQGQRIMADAGIMAVPGITPPGWSAPPALLEAMAGLDMRFISSARDLETPIASEARTHGSGLRDVSLIHPQVLPYGRLVHIPTNFQATSTADRAMAILQHGGVLAIKAHLLTRLGSYQALDGLSDSYIDMLDRLFTAIEDRFGNAIWWPTMTALAAQALAADDASEMRSTA